MDELLELIAEMEVLAGEIKSELEVRYAACSKTGSDK